MAREIQVRVRDGDGTLLQGSSISWKEGTEYRGTTEYSDGHMTLYPVSPTSSVEVTVAYKGETQTRNLASDQAVCEFDFPNTHSDTTPPTPTPAATSGSGAPQPAEKTGSPWWSSSAVIAAVVTAIGAIVVAYFQFGPSHSADAVTLAVYVRDSISAAPIPRATVVVQSSSAPAPAMSDNQGLAMIRLPSGKGEPLKIIGTAANYEDGALETRASDTPIELLLKPKPATSAPATVRARPPIATASTVAGTWEIRISGDLSLKRARSGTFDLSSIPDGRTAVRAQIQLDGAATQLNGFVSRQNNRFFLEYRAQAGTDSWNGVGQLNLSNQTLEGYITDAKGQEVPITLRKP